MSTWSKCALGLTVALAVWAQPRPLDPRSTMNITLPDDSPVALLAADWGESRSEVRGGAMVLDLHTSLSFRNTSQRRIRGITLLVLAQDVTPGGKASVSVPSLDVGPGEAFPVRIDLQLLRPLQAGAGPLVQVELDGILFDDLGFYGANKLNSRRSMTVWETEARRDRRHFKAILEAQGPEGLQKAILESLARQADRPQLNARVLAGGRATAYEPAQEVQLAFLDLRDAPVAPVAGTAQLSAHELRSPSLKLANRSKTPVRFVEIGWILKEAGGKEVVAGTLPAQVNLPPGGEAEVAQSSVLRFSRPAGASLNLRGVTGFVSNVEFADGRVWVPGRESIQHPQLQRALAPSPEEQRLIELYRKKGLTAVIEQLKRF